MHEHLVTLRFYAELNDFLPREDRFQDLPYRFRGTPPVKHAIEVHHVPHTEVDLIAVDGQSVGFDHPLADGDRVAVYPVFEGLDIAPVLQLRPAPLRKTAFLLDVPLGRLAKLLRLLGLDAAFDWRLDTRGIIHRALAEERIILTRDRRLLCARVVTHGCYIHSQGPTQQVAEVLHRCDLYRELRPFTRCLTCNGSLEDVAKHAVLHLLEPKTRQYYDTFRRCRACGRIYWKGSHYKGLEEQVQKLRSTGA